MDVMFFVCSGPSCRIRDRKVMRVPIHLPSLRLSTTINTNMPDALSSPYAFLQNLSFWDKRSQEVKE
jgi:hypothetical protein